MSSRASQAKGPRISFTVAFRGSLVQKVKGWFCHSAAGAGEYCPSLCQLVASCRDGCKSWNGKHVGPLFQCSVINYSTVDVKCPRPLKLVLSFNHCFNLRSNWWLCTRVSSKALKRRNWSFFVKVWRMQTSIISPWKQSPPGRHWLDSRNTTATLLGALFQGLFVVERWQSVAKRDQY